MRAVQFDAFRAQPEIREVPDPICPPGGALIRVHAVGVCRSDWHAWQGHDDSVALPHVPGHEFAGVVERVGEGVARFRPGDRVTAPFIQACGRCAQCRAGAPQVCPHQVQPGFDRPGAWAEQVVVTQADTNLVALPGGIDMTLAAGLGCRIGTAWHAVRLQGRVRGGHDVAVLGCGGLGLACVMVARAAGARVIAVDVSEAALAAAERLGAVPVRSGPDAVAQIRAAGAAPQEDDEDAVDLLGAGDEHGEEDAAREPGVDVTFDALGSTGTARDAIASLRPRGRHVQVGLLLGEDADPPLPMGRVIAQELEILGSHGLGAREYPGLLAEIASGALDLTGAVGRVIGLEELPDALVAMGGPQATAGMTVARLVEEG